jgi:hypothetical protein
MFDSQIRSLEERVTRAAPSEVGCCEANPSELTFHEVKEFARATFASEDGRKIKQILPAHVVRHLELGFEARCYGTAI